MGKPATTELEGAGSLQRAEHFARHGHRDWLWWVDGEVPRAAVKTKDNIKRMLLATGTKGTWALICANSGCPMKGFWAMGIIMIRNSRFG